MRLGTRVFPLVSVTLALVLLYVGRASLATPQVSSRVSSAAPLAEARYVGAATCARCHQAMHETWADGRHSRMIQPATAGSVLGDFLAAPVVLNGRQYRLRAEGGRYFI